MAKRAAGDALGGPPAKKPNLKAPLDIGPAAGEDDLNIKVLQMQNKKLSERLRERNHGQEQLEAQIRKLEREQDSYTMLQVALKRHFLELRECLLVAMVPVVESAEAVVMSEAAVQTLQQGGSLEDLFKTLHKCVQELCKGRRSASSPAEEEGDSVMHSRSLALLDELSKKHGTEVESQQLKDKIAVLETKLEELQEEAADLRFSLERSQTRGDRLEVRLESALASLQAQPPSSTGPLQPQASVESTTTTIDEGREGSSSSGAEGGVASEKSEEAEALQSAVQDAEELSKSRLEEVQKLTGQLVELRNEVDRVKLEQQQVSEAAVKESAVYKILQSQFSIAALEVSQMRAYLEDAKALLASARQQHFAQLEEIRNEEVKYQMEVREEVASLEGTLATVKRDYEVLKMEYERTLASNEQAAPIAKELRVTVDSLQKTITQHKSEVNRYKTRAHKAEQQLAKLQEDKEKEAKEKASTSVTQDMPSDPNKDTTEPSIGKAEGEEESELDKVCAQFKSVEVELQSYKQAASQEDKDKAELIAAEKKARLQVEELKKRFEDYRRDYEKRKEHIREEAARKSKSLTEDNRHLQKDLSAKKHEAQALVAEMECTAQAFEEMQEQNIRLLQQLKEKDDANFKLMSERIKFNNMHKLLMEEKELLQNQLSALEVERKRYAELVSQLEERERLTEATLQGVDKELVLQQQTSESHRKRAEESVQELAQAQLLTADKQRLVESVQQTLAKRTEECEQENQLHKRSAEEVIALKKKLEKYKSREWMTAGDEVLLEEIKVYKAKLNCPCCSARKKDTVLTKCFHVFCSECIRNRYDSRLRKCPKCGAAFGANDFHKIYLS